MIPVPDDSARAPDLELSENERYRALPWSVELSQRISRRRFLRRSADGIFAGVAGIMVGEVAISSLIKSPRRVLPNYPVDQTRSTGCGCFAGCGPSPCCGQACCSQDCCKPFSSSCKNSSGSCGPNFAGHGSTNCWSHTTTSGNCVILTVCCDCNSRCSTGVCICNTRVKHCPGEPWPRWDAAAGRFVPA